MVEINFFDPMFTSPGLDEIVCLKNNKRYIGESEFFLHRLGGHLKDLKNQTHHCHALQSDFNSYGLNVFKAKVLTYGPQWQEREVRLQEEKRLIEKIGKSKVYNFDVTSRKKAPCYKSYKYDGQIFNTIQALRQYYNTKALTEKTISRPLSETTFRRNFTNPLAPFRSEIEFIENTKQYQQYLVYGETLKGLEAIVEKGYALNKRIAKYRLSSSKWPDYQYIDKVTVKNKRRKLSVEGQLYTTEEVIAKGLAETREVIYARVRSKNQKWINWFWVESEKEKVY